MYMYVDWRHQHFLDIVFFCGKPCLQWSPLLLPHLAYLSNIERINNIHLRTQSRKNTLGNLGKCCLRVFFSVFFLCKLGEGKQDICDQPLVRKTKSNGRPFFTKGTMISEVT